MPRCSHYSSTMPGLRIFLDNLMSIFPGAKRVKKEGSTECQWITLYRGIEIKELWPLNIHEDIFKDIVQFIPGKYTIKKYVTIWLFVPLKVEASVTAFIVTAIGS